MCNFSQCFRLQRHVVFLTHLLQSTVVPFDLDSKLIYIVWFDMLNNIADAKFFGVNHSQTPARAALGSLYKGIILYVYYLHTL